MPKKSLSESPTVSKKENENTVRQRSNVQPAPPVFLNFKDGRAELEWGGQSLDGASVNWKLEVATMKGPFEQRYR